MKWTAGRNGSIEIETEDGIAISFKDLEALDKFADELVDARNEVAEALEDEEPGETT